VIAIAGPVLTAAAIIVASLIGLSKLGGTPVTVSGSNSAQATIVGSNNNQTTYTNNTLSANPSVPAAARIVVSDFSPVQAAGKPYYDWKIRMTNRGSLPGYTPRMRVQVRLTTAALSPDETDDEMSKTRAEALVEPPKRRQQMEVGQDQFITLQERGISAEDMQALRSGEKHLYLWVALAFLDDSVAPGKFWISEYCGELEPDLNTIRICGQKTAISE
jgi:hypothetical protein